MLKNLDLKYGIKKEGLISSLPKPKVFDDDFDQKKLKKTKFLVSKNSQNNLMSSE